MKKVKYVLTASFLLWAAILSAQQPNFSKKFLKSTSFVNKAELAICDNDLKTAVLYYDSAFSVRKKPFTRDVFNYALCEKKLGNTAKADSIFKLLFFENFKKQNLANCIDTTKFYAQKQEKLTKYVKLYQAVAEIYNTDQTTNRSRYVDMDKYLNTVLNNAKRIMKLTHEVEKDSLKLFSLDNSVLFFPIVHYFQLWQVSTSPRMKNWPIFSSVRKVDFNKVGFDHFLIEQTEKGNFDPHVLAELFSILGQDVGSVIVKQFNNYILVLKPSYLSQNKLNVINKNRKKMGLESYSDYFRKAEYTDSLLNNGEPFVVINKDSLSAIYGKKKNSCNFILTGGYRMGYGSKSDEQAREAYKRAKEVLENMK